MYTQIKYLVIKGGDYMLFEKLTKKEKILRLYKTGMTQAQIARELRTNQNYVWQVVNENKEIK
jgi:transcriptional regulator